MKTLPDLLRRGIGCCCCLLVIALCAPYLYAACDSAHVWTNKGFTWNDDGTTAAAVWVCSACGAQQTTQADVITDHKQSVKATCSHPGSTTKTAYASIDGVTAQDSRTTEVPMLEHSFTPPQFTWNPSDFSCTAQWTCTVGDETESASCQVNKETGPPSGNDPIGGIRYTTSITVGGKIYTDTYFTRGLDTVHAYGTPAIVWGEGYQTAQIVAVCSLCEDGNPGKTISADCTVQTVRKPANCNREGSVVYTARGALLDQVLTDTVTEILPITAHDFANPVFAWNGERCSAAYTCNNCEKTYLDDCRITEERLYSDCTENGVLTKTASITLNNITYTDAKESVLPPKGHTTRRVPGKEPTCTEEGFTDGFVCADCNAVLTPQTTLPVHGHTKATINGVAATCMDAGLSDGVICAVCKTVLTPQTELPATGHTPLTEDDIPATCTEPGYTTGTVCSVCQDILAKGAELAPLGHEYGQALFTWSHDGTTVYASKTCTRRCGSVIYGTVTFDRNTVTQNGQTITVVTADAVFSDGSTAQEQKRYSASGEEIPTTPTVPTTPDTPSTVDPAPVVPRFDDVAPDSYYYDAVAWAAQQNITQGTGNGAFSPDMICSRAQIVTMLWRAAGSPAVKSTSVFSDVDSASYYAKAVAWAAEAGITAGTSSTTFSPDVKCSRAQIVTMLWRAAGCPTVNRTSVFTDVPADAWYNDAVTWAVAHGITVGTGSGKFSPDADCTRAQIVTFLYRTRNLLEIMR